MKLSIVIPVYNEVGTIAEIVRRVRAVPLVVLVGYGEDSGSVVDFEREIVIVDDGSTDSTREILHMLIGDPDVTVVEQVARDQGLGAGPIETVEVPGFQQVEYTQFVVKTFVDSGGKLAEAVRQEQEAMDELVKLYRQTVGG